MFIVVSYDVIDDRRRAKLHRLLKNYGTWTQYSVFECDLRPRQLRELQAHVHEIVNKAVDQVRFYPLNAEDVRHIQVIGSGVPAVDPLLYLVGDDPYRPPQPRRKSKKARSP